MMNRLGRIGSTPFPFQFFSTRFLSSSCELFVGGLSSKINPDALESLFLEYGKIVWVRVPMHKKSGNAKGYAFINFESKKDATAAAMALDGQPFGGRAMSVSLAKKELSSQGLED